MAITIITFTLKRFMHLSYLIRCRLQAYTSIETVVKAEWSKMRTIHSSLSRVSCSVKWVGWRFWKFKILVQAFLWKMHNIFFNYVTYATWSGSTNSNVLLLFFFNSFLALKRIILKQNFIFYVIRTFVYSSKPVFLNLKYFLS